MKSGDQDPRSKTYWKFKEGDLYLGDCLEVMDGLPEASVDLVFGSPPYEDARLYGELQFKMKGQEWVDWMVGVFKSCLRVTKGLVAMVVGHGKGARKWSGAPALLCADLIREGINLRSPCIYRRNGIMGSGGKDWLRADFEWIICATNSKEELPWSDNTALGHPPRYGPGGEMSYRTKSGRRVNQWGRQEPVGKTHTCTEPQKDGTRKEASVKPSHKFTNRKKYDGVTKANPGNVIDCGACGYGHQGSNIAHDNEAPFPEKLVDFFVRSFCPPDGVVLDPFCGSSTTPAVAIKTGRRFIGIDIRKSQIELGKRRIRQARINRGLGII